MKTLFTILVLLTASNKLQAQVIQEWVARYNGPGNSFDEANSIAVDGSGNVYVTGPSSSSVTASSEDYATIKYNPSGVQQWVARYNGPGNSYDRAYSIAVDGSGNVFVTGSSSGSGTSDDYATIKYNSSGESAWLARFNGLGNSGDYAYSIALDGSGNVYVTGYSSGSGTSDDYATIKYNSSGVQQWLARYNGPENFYDRANSIAVDDSGNVYVTGFSSGSSTGSDYATIKYNSSGVQQWVARYNGPGNSSDYANSIALDGSGNVYVAGSSSGSGTGSDYATLKYTPSGVQQWVARYNGSGNSNDGANSIALDSSGNVYVAGSSSGNGTGSDYATIKYNSSGDSVWVARYNGPGNSSDYASSIALDGSGNVYVAGGSIGSETGSDYATIKYNSSGDSVWVARYKGPGNSSDYASSIALDGSGNVYVAGGSIGSGLDFDYATIKYSQSTGIQQISSIVPKQFSLSQNYPNPFNPTTNIEFAILQESFVILKVYDIAGKEVAELVNDYLSAGKFRYEFSSASLSSGLYVYKLDTDKFTEAKKMIVLK
jgi:uncharacterized delta-60 repeat protein